MTCPRCGADDCVAVKEDGTMWFCFGCSEGGEFDDGESPLPVVGPSDALGTQVRG